jgi:hypothetical protein
MLGRIIAQIDPQPNMIYKSCLVSYNTNMNVPAEAREVLLQDAIARDRTTARRAALWEVLSQERYLTREQLINRVEDKLGKGCFGDFAWKDTFYRDLRVVKGAFKAAGYHLAYSRSGGQRGYYLRDRPAVGTELAALIVASVREVDPDQIQIFKQHSLEQRFQQGCSITNLACQVVTNRIRQENPEISLSEAQQQALQGRNVA